MGVVVALRCAVVGPGRRWLVRVAVLGRTLAWVEAFSDVKNNELKNCFRAKYDQGRSLRAVDLPGAEEEEVRATEQPLETHRSRNKTEHQQS